MRARGNFLSNKANLKHLLCTNGLSHKKMICYILDNDTHIKNMSTKFEINRTNSVGDIWYTVQAEELRGTTNNSAIF